LEGLRQAFVDYLQYGEKSVRMMRVGSDTADGIRKAIKSLEIKSSVYSEMYPLPVTGDSLSELAEHDPILIAIEDGDTGTALIYSSIRKFEVRNEIKKDDVPVQARPIFKQYTEIYGVAEELRQAHDIVIVPRSGATIEVRIDFPEGSNRDIQSAAN